MPGLYQRLEQAVWTDPEGEVTPSRALATRAARTVWMAVEGFETDACFLRASALTLASMLALVPALAASFAYVRGLGWTGQRLETLLLQRATVLSPDAVSTVVSWVDHISITGLGVMGALFAVFAALSLLFQIEDAFDAVWGSPEGRGRVRRAADAMILIVSAPLLLAVVASSEAWIRSHTAVSWFESFGALEVVLRLVLGLFWYLLVCGTFAVLYYLLPSAPVHRSAALIGGVLAGVTWQFAQSLYVDFQVGLGGYNAVYGALAQLPALVFWMWTSWVVVLGGAEIAAAWQSLEACQRRYDPALVSAAARERLALSIAIELADTAYARRSAPTLAELAAQLSMPVRTVADVFRALDDAGLVHTGGEEQKQCFLSLSPGSIPVERVIGAARGPDEAGTHRERPAVAEVLARLASARRGAFEGSTLADLVDARA